MANALPALSKLSRHISYLYISDPKASSYDNPQRTGSLLKKMMNLQMIETYQNLNQQMRLQTRTQSNKLSGFDELK